MKRYADHLVINSSADFLPAIRLDTLFTSYQLSDVNIVSVGDNFGGTLSNFQLRPRTKV